jgi:hypothetical protein
MDDVGAQMTSKRTRHGKTEFEDVGIRLALDAGCSIWEMSDTFDDAVRAHRKGEKNNDC